MVNEKKIDFMIIGAQKAGTSSLSYYLSQHPQILTHYTYEFIYFFQDDVFSKGFETAFNHNYKIDDTNKFLLAKNVMVMYSQDALKRLYMHNPDVKIIIVLRNPVARAYSSFWFAKSTGRERALSFEDAISGKENNQAATNKYIQQNLQYLEMGEYAKYLKNVMDIFPVKNIKVIIFEDFVKDLENEMNDVLKFLQLPLISLDTSKKINESKAAKSQLLANLTTPGKKSKLSKLIPLKYKNKIRKFIMKHNSKPFKAPPLNEKTKEELNQYYKEYNIELANILNKKLPWSNN